MTEERWFTYFKGPGKRQLVPRNGKGWVATILFILVLLLPTPLVIVFAERAPWIAFAQFLWIGPVIFLFWRWAKSKSEVIDMSETSRDWQEFKRWKEEQRRRGR